MPTGLDIQTHSRMQTFKTCPRKHQIQYLHGIRKTEESASFRFGRAAHVGLDLRAQGKSMTEVVQTIRDNYAVGMTSVPAEYHADRELECEIVVRLLCAYDWRWLAEYAEIVATERCFSLPLRNPETGKETSVYRVAGRIDKIIRLPDGCLAVLEHKTTGDPIEPTSDYWKRTRFDHQVSLYFWAARQLGYHVETIIYDVLHKPGIRPRKLTKAQQKEFNCERETLQMFGDRLTADIGERPDFYFQRQEVPRLQADIDEFLHELWDQQKAIRAAELNGRHYRNTAVCTSPYRCEYLDICHGGNGEEVPEGFRRIDNIHPELE